MQREINTTGLHVFDSFIFYQATSKSINDHTSRLVKK